MKPKLKFINTKHILYYEAIDIRINCFFKGMSNNHNLINDDYEKKGYHLVCLNKEGRVIGTGRLNIENTKGIISQMAVPVDNQNKGIGKILLSELIKKCESYNLNLIELSARDTAIAFYEKNGFIVVGEKYPSAKTGIIHQKMLKKKKQRDNTI